VLVLVALLALASACGAPDPTRQTSPTTGSTDTRPSPATTQPSDPTKAVLAAYQRVWQLWLQDNNPPNPDDPRLAEVEADGQLTGARMSIERNKDLGHALRLPPHSVYRHVATVAFDLTKRSARVTDCALDDGVVVQVSTGAVINGDVQTQLIVSTMDLIDGYWKVTSSKFVKTWPGETSCGTR
jgi:hypothetical protein